MSIIKKRKELRGSEGKIHYTFRDDNPEIELGTLADNKDFDLEVTEFGIIINIQGEIAALTVEETIDFAKLLMDSMLPGACTKS